MVTLARPGFEEQWYRWAVGIKAVEPVREDDFKSLIEGEGDTGGTSGAGRELKVSFFMCLIAGQDRGRGLKGNSEKCERVQDSVNTLRRKVPVV